MHVFPDIQLPVSPLNLVPSRNLTRTDGYLFLCLNSN